MHGIIILWAMYWGVFGQLEPRIEVVIPTAEQEAEYVWRTLQDVAFFEANAYQISLPEGPLIEELKARVKSNRLENGDRAALVAYIREQVYDAADYARGYQQVTREIARLDQMVAEIESRSYAWGFKSFPRYKVVLTLYGPGGSYNPDDGSILLYTTETGQFKQYGNPINTLIHEITHIGIEQSIIQPLAVPHGLKERIVDTFVSLHFGDQLPDYRIQAMGDEGIDQYFTTLKDISDLRGIVLRYMESR
ncbi:MAG: hypothetical protein AAGA85_03595 [Bacteroidota bacterium]